jgi:hypothetical protein
MNLDRNLLSAVLDPEMRSQEGLMLEQTEVYKLALSAAKLARPIDSKLYQNTSWKI